MENTFIKIGEGKDKSNLKETIFKMDTTEKNLLRNFLEVRNNGLLFNRCNVDKSGKPTISDPDTGRPISLIICRNN